MKVSSYQTTLSLNGQVTLYFQEVKRYGNTVPSFITQVTEVGVLFIRHIEFIIIQ